MRPSGVSPLWKGAILVWAMYTIKNEKREALPNASLSSEAEDAPPSEAEDEGEPAADAGEWSGFVFEAPLAG